MTRTRKATKKGLAGAMKAPNRHPLLLLLLCSLRRNSVPSNAAPHITVLQVTPAQLLLRHFLPMASTMASIHTAEVPKELHERRIRRIVAEQVIIAMERSQVPGSCRLAVQVG
jgi:hypothetical protein